MIILLLAMELPLLKRLLVSQDEVRSISSCESCFIGMHFIYYCCFGPVLCSKVVSCFFDGTDIFTQMGL